MTLYSHTLYSLTHSFLYNYYNEHRSTHSLPCTYIGLKVATVNPKYLFVTMTTFKVELLYSGTTRNVLITRCRIHSI